MSPLNTNLLGKFQMRMFSTMGKEWDPRKDYYKALNVGKNATEKELKVAYYKLAQKYHPDKAGGNEAKFKEISNAYSILGDKSKRQQYDMDRGSGAGANPYSGFGRT